MSHLRGLGCEILEEHGSLWIQSVEEIRLLQEYETSRRCESLVGHCLSCCVRAVDDLSIKCLLAVDYLRKL